MTWWQWFLVALAIIACGLLAITLIVGVDIVTLVTVLLRGPIK